MNLWLKNDNTYILNVIYGHWQVINGVLPSSIWVYRVDYNKHGECAVFISFQWNKLFILGDNDFCSS